MAQQVAVMAFRKRLRNRGYKYISIRDISDCRDGSTYRVTAVDPFAGVEVSRDMSVIEMYYLFR